MATMDAPPRKRPRASQAVIATGSKAKPSRQQTTRKALSEHMESVHSKVVRDVMTSLTAAAEIMDPTGNDRANRSPNSVTRTWQHASWGYAKTVPELGAATKFVGNCLARCNLMVGKRSLDGSVEQGFDGEAPVEGLDNDVANEAADLIAHLRSAIGGQSELLRSYGEKAFVAGESYLLPVDTAAGLVFDVLSTQELAREGKGWVRYYGPGGDTEEIPADTRPIRVWRPDPQFGQLADSSVRSCMEILEELVILTRLVRSAAISRIALAGILAIADEFDSPLDDAAGDGSMDESMNPLAVDMVNTGSKAIDDPASAAAWMPYILQGDVDLIDRGIKLIQFRTDDAEHVVKRREAVERLAQGLDLPVEVVLGHQSTTYANAMQVSEDTFKLHIEPILQLLCDALTWGYLWPAMAKARGISPERLKDAPYPDDVLSVAVTYDARKLISRPDRVREMSLVYTKDQTFSTIKTSEMREALGLDPDEPPDMEEIKMKIDAFRLAHIREIVSAPPGDAAVPIDQSKEGPTPGSSGGEQAIAQTKTDVEDAQAGAQPADGQETAEQKAAREAATTASGVLLSYQIAALAELAIERAVEKVGAKLRSKIGSLPAGDVTRRSVEECPNGDVARILGSEVTTRFLGREDLVAAEIRAFRRIVGKCADDSGLPYPGRIADAAAEMTAAEAHARLFGEPWTNPVEQCIALVTAG